MNNEMMKMIQGQLGYVFDEPMLLKQAFTRKSYAEEHHDAHDNEVLEFYGDKALEFIVMKKLSNRFGETIRNSHYESKSKEGQLTEIKKKLICKKMLAHCIDVLGFANYLLMGKGDEIQNIQDQDSVKEDLFEAIVGAVAIDSDWNIEALTRVVDKMLTTEFYFENGFDDEPDYVHLLQQWFQKKYHMTPNYSVVLGIGSPELFEEALDGGLFTCTLNIPNIGFFDAPGQTKADARMKVAKKAYQYIEQNNLILSQKDQKDIPSLERAINQLQELYQKGYIGEPRYTFTETHDLDGNPVWECICEVQGVDAGWTGVHPSKKQAKKAAACYMLTFGLGEVDKDEA